jgi:glutamate 5-kinase
MGAKYTEAGRLVVKVGTGFLFDKSEGEGNGYRFRPDQMDALTEELSAIADSGKEVALVSSGAIATAVCEFRKPVPESKYGKAELAGMGQHILMGRYSEMFRKRGKFCAQCLVTHDDIRHRSRRLNLRAVQDGYFEKGTIAIYNENDTISTDEITFGDNDILAAMLAKCLDAYLLVMLSHAVEGLGTGGGESKDRAREILSAGEKPIHMEIINGRYEMENSIWKPKISLLF